MEKLFFDSSQTCNLIGRSKNLRDGVMMARDDNKMENGNFVQIAR